MTRKNLDTRAYPRSTPSEIEQIQKSALRRRMQMLPGKGPIEPEKEESVSHFKGEGEAIVLGPVRKPIPQAHKDENDDPD